MISLSRVTKSYGLATVVDDVSLDLPAGQCLALLGPNGAGKTTLLRILGTLLRPTAGQVCIGGIDALREPEKARALVGMVGHGSYLYADLTALENLRFWAVMGGTPSAAEQLMGALQQVELEAVAHERVRTFSAGMKRRLGLARVLLGHARLLLLDEPFTELDQRARKWLGEFLLGFKAGGGSVIVATHSFGSGLAVSDRVGILHGGRLIVDRPCGDLSWDELRRLYDSLTEGSGALA
jgi:heme ABC exporter ATP-binding subunit CcmA